MRLSIIYLPLLVSVSNAYGFDAYDGFDCDGTEVAVVNPAGTGICYDLTNTETVKVINANSGDQLCYYLETGCSDAYQRSFGNGCFQAGPAYSVKFTGDC